ncbi:MAG: hypothetical protein U5K79_22010 [Cyclobacteriaceae bacterium]|nr:hypothetical protein [Cyclobacteriaceae bacterium]
MAYSVSDAQTFNREINGLIEAMTRLNKEEGFLICNDHEEELTVDRKKIHIMPLAEMADT